MEKDSFAYHKQHDQLYSRDTWKFFSLLQPLTDLQLITFSVNHKFCQLQKTRDVKAIDNDFLMLVLKFTHQDKERLKGVCQNVTNHNNDKS